MIKKITIPQKLAELIQELEEVCHEVSAREVLESDMLLVIDACNSVIKNADATPMQIAESIKNKTQARIYLKVLREID